MRPRNKNEKIDPEKNAQAYIDALRLIIHYQLQKNAQIRPASPLTRLAHAARPGDVVFYNNLKSEYKSYVDTINDPKKTAVEKLEALKKFASDPKYQDKAKYGGDLHGVINDIDHHDRYESSGVKREFDEVAHEIEAGAAHYVRAIEKLIIEMKSLVVDKVYKDEYAPYLHGVKDQGITMIQKLEEMQNWAVMMKDKKQQGGKAARNVNKVHEMIAAIKPLQIYEKSNMNNKEFRKNAMHASAPVAKPQKATSAPVGTVSRGGVFAREKQPVGKAVSDPGPSKDNQGPKKKF